MLSGMVERRMRASIARVGSVWYTAWVDAGQPDLKKLLEKELIEEKETEDKKLKINDREAGDIGAVLDPREMLFGTCCGHRMGPCNEKMPQIDSCNPMLKSEGVARSVPDQHGH